MKYFIIFLWLAFVVFSFYKVFSLCKALKQKLRAQIVSKLKELEMSHQFRPLKYVADIILNAPRSTQKKLLESLFKADLKPLKDYLKQKKQALFLEGWQVLHNDTPEKLEKILKNLPQRGLSKAEKNLKKLFEGAVFMHKTDLKKAAQKADAAAERFHKCQDFEAEAEADLLLFEIMRMADFDDPAELYLSHAENLYQKENLTEGLGRIKALKGVKELMAQNDARALALLEDALDLAKKSKQNVLACQILNLLKEVCFRLDKKDAQKRYESALKREIEKISDKRLQKRLKERMNLNKIKKERVKKGKK